VLLFACTHFGRSISRFVRCGRGSWFPTFDCSLRRRRPPALAAGGALPENKPTSDVLCRRRSTHSSAPPRNTLARLSSCDEIRASPRRPEACARCSVRATHHHFRTPVTVSLTSSCELDETQLRIRPRKSSCLTPVRRAPFVHPPSRGGQSSCVTRSSLERRSRVACGYASRRTQQVIDQRCVRPATANDTSTTGTHASFGDRPLRSPPVRTRACFRCMARFTTPHALRVSRFQRLGRCLPATSNTSDPSDAPVITLRLPLSLPKQWGGRAPLPMVWERRHLRGRDQDHLIAQRLVKAVARRMIQSVFHRTGNGHACEV